MTTTPMTVRGNEQGRKVYRSLVLVSSAHWHEQWGAPDTVSFVPIHLMLWSMMSMSLFDLQYHRNPLLFSGENSVIKRAIIDDNVSIGRNVKITNKDNIEEADHTDDGYVIQHGIVVVLKGATIPDGTEI